MRKMVLLYNFTPERLGRLRFLCMRLGVQARVVDPAEWNQTIGALCGLAPQQETADPTPSFSEEMLVFSGFSAPQMSGMLSAMRQAGWKPPALKAVITPTNATWTSTTLYHELCAERDALSTSSPRPHE